MSWSRDSYAWRSHQLAAAGPVLSFASGLAARSSTAVHHPASRLVGGRQRGAHSTGNDQATDEGTSDQIEESTEVKLARLMAVLFLAKEPLSSRKLSQYSNLADGTEARTLVTHLNRQLDGQGRSFRAEAVAGGYQLVTRAKFAKWLRRLTYVPGEVRLSAPAMETLAVVAYRQPVMRADVEAIRGVSCGDILSQLLDRDLIRIGGRADELGRPYLYNTTKRFMQVFGLRSLEQLPATSHVAAEPVEEDSTPDTLPENGSNETAEN